MKNCVFIQILWKKDKEKYSLKLDWNNEMNIKRKKEIKVKAIKCCVWINYKKTIINKKRNKVLTQKLKGLIVDSINEDFIGSKILFTIVNEFWGDFNNLSIEFDHFKHVLKLLKKNTIQMICKFFQSFFKLK